MLEHEHQLMLRAVETAHSGIGFFPDAEVLEFGIDSPASPQQLTQMPPIHADEVDGALPAVSGVVAECPGKKLGKFLRGHLARGHHKLGVLDPAMGSKNALDRHIIGRIGEDHLGATVAHQKTVVLDA